MIRSASSAVLLLPPNTRAACLNDWVQRLYMAYVYLSLRQQKIRVDFWDYLDEGTSFEAKVQAALSGCKRTPRTYGVGLFVGNKKSGLWVLREIKRQDPQGRVIAFGPFAAVFYRYILEQGLADIVILSDAEFVFIQLCSMSTNFSRVPNLAYRHRSRVKLSRCRIFKDLDQLPFAGEYFISRGIKNIPVIMSRGCAHRCSFCDRPRLWGEGLRVRSAENIVDEIELLVKKYKVKSVVFADADFLTVKLQAEAVCRQILRRSLKISWECSTRVDRVDQDMLALMRLAGCGRVHFGIESGDGLTLKKIGKKYAPQVILQAVQGARNAGISVGLFLMVGTPGESRRSLAATRRLLKLLSPFAGLTVNPLVILPGTPMYADLVKKGRIKENDYFENDALEFFDRDKQLYLKEFPALNKFFEGSRGGYETLPRKGKK